MPDFEEPPIFAERDRLIAALRAEKEARGRDEAELASVCQREAEMIARYDARLDAAEARAERAEEHARAGWALATHWQNRYTERAMADYARENRIRQHAEDEALERAARLADEKAEIDADDLYWGMSEMQLALKGQARHFAAAIRAMKGGEK